MGKITSIKLNGISQEQTPNKNPSVTKLASVLIIEGQRLPYIGKTISFYIHFSPGSFKGAHPESYARRGDFHISLFYHLRKHLAEFQRNPVLREPVVGHSFPFFI
jgi:hypothetical protein